ncbi:hypothetical protein ACFLR2_02515 [Chlamydiota bacterium]
MCFLNRTPSSTDSTTLQTHWEAQAPRSATDLAVKKIAVALIALVNIAALGIALYYIVSYCPIPSKALLASPFVVGVLGALAYLNFPTCGISSMNYTNYVNPATLVGKGLAYLFFGPLMYSVNHIDWTPYHDRIRANRISLDLETLPFDEVADKYGKNFGNLVKYGFINETHEQELKELYEAYKPVKEATAFWKQEGMETCEQAKMVQDKRTKLQTRWDTFKKGTKYNFPKPDMPEYDFEKPSTRWALFVRKHLCFNDPVDFACVLKA